MNPLVNIVPFYKFFFEFSELNGHSIGVCHYINEYFQILNVIQHQDARFLFLKNNHNHSINFIYRLYFHLSIYFVFSNTKLFTPKIIN